MNTINSQIFNEKNERNYCTIHSIEVGYFCIDENCFAKNRAACRDCIVSGQHKNH